MRKALWRAGWEVLRVLVGLPCSALIACWDGLGGFRREFGRTWQARAQAGDSAYWWQIRANRREKARAEGRSGGEMEGRGG